MFAATRATTVKAVRALKRPASTLSVGGFGGNGYHPKAGCVSGWAVVACVPPCLSKTLEVLVDGYRFLFTEDQVESDISNEPLDLVGTFVPQ